MYKFLNLNFSKYNYLLINFLNVWLFLNVYSVSLFNQEVIEKLTIIMQNPIESLT